MEKTIAILKESWRPVLMLIFGFIVLYNKILAPVFGLPFSELEEGFWHLLTVSVGGYVVGRKLGEGEGLFVYKLIHS